MPGWDRNALRHSVQQKPEGSEHAAATELQPGKNARVIQKIRLDVCDGVGI